MYVRRFKLSATRISRVAYCFQSSPVSRRTMLFIAALASSVVLSSFRNIRKQPPQFHQQRHRRQAEHRQVFDIVGTEHWFDDRCKLPPQVAFEFIGGIYPRRLLGEGPRVDDSSRSISMLEIVPSEKSEEKTSKAVDFVLTHRPILIC